MAERASARWQAMVKGDWEGAYAYLSPGSREVTPLTRFQSRSRVVQYRAAKVEKVTCEAEVCKVAVSLTYDHTVMKGVVTPLEETWLIEGGQAWMVYTG